MIDENRQMLVWEKEASLMSLKIVNAVADQFLLLH